MLLLLVYINGVGRDGCVLCLIAFYSLLLTFCDVRISKLFPMTMTCTFLVLIDHVFSLKYNATVVQLSVHLDYLQNICMAICNTQNALSCLHRKSFLLAHGYCMTSMKASSPRIRGAFHSCQLFLFTAVT